MSTKVLFADLVSFFLRLRFKKLFLQPTHKIHSDEELHLRLDVVPKILKSLVCDLVPEAFVISFKVRLLQLLMAIY